MDTPRVPVGHESDIKTVMLKLVFDKAMYVLCMLTARAHAGLDLVKVVVVIAVGMPLSLWVTAQTAVTIRESSNTELLPTPPQAPSAPFTQAHRAAWGAAAVASLAAVILSSSTQVGFVPRLART